MNLLAPFSALRNGRFARLYIAQTISQLGDAFTWVGLALLAFELAGAGASLVLGVALTLRVSAFVLLAPLAGVLADRLDRRTTLALTHFGRALVISLMPLVAQVWQVYVLVFALNVLTAFFTPTNQATVPLVMGQEDADQAFALSSATTELFSIVGPGLAGVLATLTGGRSLFYLDAATFIVAGLLILSLPSLRPSQAGESQASRWQDIRDGTARLWRDPPIRFAMLMELIAALTGALVLVVTVVRIKGELGLGDAEYGWVMALYGLGATTGALAVGAVGQRIPRTLFIFVGALLSVLAVLPADALTFAPLMMLWLVAGVGQNWVNLPVKTLLAEHTEEAAQGRVYGAHFAWSHLWWAFAYPLTSLLSAQVSYTFLYGGLIAFLGLLLATLSFYRSVPKAIFQR